jgi:hypothetical protein
MPAATMVHLARYCCRRRRVFRRFGFVQVDWVVAMIRQQNQVQKRRLLGQHRSQSPGLEILASLNGRSENVRVLQVVIAELELGNIERHIFAAHFVERADHAALENRPEAFDGLSMDCADDVLAFGVINDTVRIFAVKPLVAWILIGAKQADSVGNSFSDKCIKRDSLDVRDYPRDHISLAADRANDRSFARADAAGSTAAAALIQMPVLGQAADESLVDLDNSAELVNVLHKCNADFVTHFPSGFIGTEPHVPINLKCAYSLFAGKHQVNDAIPVAERFVRVLKDRAGYVRKAIAGFWSALIALPAPRMVWKLVWALCAAARATNAFRPPSCNEIGTARVLVREHLFKFRDGSIDELVLAVYGP